MNIKTVTVVGATGTMGANVAGIFASFGNAKVYCVGRDIEKVQRTIPRIIKSVKADSIAKKLIPADFSNLDQCVKESDLVFESLFEDFELKSTIAKKIANALQPHAVSCTGTSGLSVTALAKCYPDSLRGNFFGVHMYNPPYNMPLCELTPTCYSNRAMLSDLKEYLSHILYRTVVEVKDSPAFLGNRIGFQFINEALQYAEQYKDYGGIDYIDAILGPFTGRVMPPLITSDFVGLDVHKAIVDYIYENTHDYAHDTFVLPEYAQQLISEGKLGRKSGGGLYRVVNLNDGAKKLTVFDINSRQYRDIIPYAFPFAEKMKSFLSEGEYRKAFERLVFNHSQEASICRHFILNYIVYSLYAAQSVGDSIDSADDVMATGFNWCPPLAMYQVLSSIVDVSALIRETLPCNALAQEIDINKLLAEVKPSKYDYRPFFKSGRK